MFYSSEKSVLRKILYFPSRISVSCATQKCDMVTTHHSSYTLLSVEWSLTEVKNEMKFQSLNSQSGRGRLQEVPNIVIWLGSIWCFGKLVADEERCSLMRGDRNQRFDFILVDGFILCSSDWKNDWRANLTLILKLNCRIINPRAFVILSQKMS